jgi:DNA-binding transcriptional MerR regulator
MLTTTELSKKTGLTYRQVDYYTREGVISPINLVSGSGNRRYYDRGLIEKLTMVKSISDAFQEKHFRGGGTHLPLRIVKDILDRWGDGELEIAPGIKIDWSVTLKKED